MKLALWISLGALGLVASVAGCVTEAESLFGTGSNSAGAGGAAGSGQGGNSVSTSSSSSGDASSSSSGGGSGGGAGGGGGQSSSSSSSSSSSGTNVTVFCAGSECKPGEICCYHFQNASLHHCSADANCGAGFGVLNCNGPSDCPGEFCCVTRVNNQYYSGSSCQPMCDGPPTEFIACESDASVCPAGLNCQQSSSLGTGYRLCR